jgi:bifunctional DNA-binding transcriptional regulator/antitoxin component of YhaV-PrlF toxin-antitoxin module
MKLASDRGHFVLPAAILRQFGLKKGDRLKVTAKGHTIVVTPVSVEIMITERK